MSSSHKKGLAELLLNLNKLLPTGITFLFQLINPLLTNYDNTCTVLNKTLETLLIVLCSFVCCFVSFTDSYTGSDGKTHYAIVTPKGLWPSSSLNSYSLDLSKFKLCFRDFVHAFISVMVFANFALLDPKMVRCFYPHFESTHNILLLVLTTILRLLLVVVSFIYPNNRHGIDCPQLEDSTVTSMQLAFSQV
ncbi:hypothetical protein UlMin_021426 [Ulmus minor]